MIWENYFLKTGTAFSSFWTEYLEEEKRDILFIMGMGFDPRTNVGIKEIFNIDSNGLRHSTILRYYKTEQDIALQNTTEVQRHLNDLTNFLQEKALPNFSVKNAILRSEDDKSIASISATQLFVENDILDFTDVVIDISAMPRGIFLPLINRLLIIINSINSKTTNGQLKNLHVIVTENPDLDSLIHDRGEADEAIFIHGLSITDTAKTQDYKEVWIPLLGEGQKKQYEVIQKGIEPAETCPVLPFPSEDLKRGDKLIIEYQDVLFNDFNFDSKNIIYADEGNPFQVYRLLYKAIKRYDKSLSILNGCKIIISALSSKLLTVGAFMAVYEARLEKKVVGIKHVESLGHQLDDGADEKLKDILEKNNLVEIWLAGTPYGKLKNEK